MSVVTIGDEGVMQRMVNAKVVEHLKDAGYNLCYQDTIMLYYDAERNRFIDEDGFIVYNIHDYITPNELFLFRYYKEYMLLEKNGRYIELFYPEDEYYFDYPNEN